MAKDAPHRPNVTHLKDAIDRGRTGSKVDARDPAAAPLGTDEEAAGTPATDAQVQQALHRETAANPPDHRRRQVRSGPNAATGSLGDAPPKSRNA